MTLLVVSSVVFSSAAKADLLFTVNQLNSDVVITASGSLDLTSLTAKGSGGTIGGLVESVPTTSAFGVGPLVGGDVWLGAVTGDSPLFYTGGQFFADSQTGTALDFVPLYPDGSGNAAIFAPADYGSGDPISGTATFDNTTLAAIGFISGTYNYTVGSDPDSFLVTVNVGSSTPAPASASLLAGGLALLLIAARRKTVALDKGCKR